MRVPVLIVSLVGACLSDGAHVKVKATEGDQVLLTCSSDRKIWGKPLSSVDWFKMETINKMKLYLVQFQRYPGRELFDIHKEAKDRFDTLLADHTILRINQTEVGDKGLYKCAVTYGEDSDQVYFDVTVTQSSPTSAQPLADTSSISVNYLYNNTEPRRPAIHDLKVILPVGFVCIFLTGVCVSLLIVRRFRKRKHKQGAAAEPMLRSPTNSDIITREDTTRDNGISSGDHSTLNQNSTVSEAKQWRAMEFTNANWDRINKSIHNIEVPQGVRFLNILLLGLVGHGKSSFARTCHASVVTDKERGVQDLGRLHIGNIVAGESSTTTRFRGHVFPNETDQKMCFRLYDTKGIGKDVDETLSPEIIRHILQGHIKDGYSFAKNIRESEHFRENPILENRIHCVALCVEAIQITDSDTESTHIIKFLQQLKRAIYEEDIHVYILVTKIDNICTKTDKDTTYALQSPEIKDVIKAVTDALGIPANKVYPLRNYVSQKERDLGIDILALNAMQAMLDSACSYVISCMQTVDE